MNHSVFGRKLSRTKNERRRLFMVLVRDLITHSQIKTTHAKAKAIQPLIEKLITKAKKGTPAAYGIILKTIDDGVLAKQLMADAKDRFAGRTSGYTRIIKIGVRRGDATEEVFLSFVDEVIKSEVVKTTQEIKDLPADKVGNEQKTTQKIEKVEKVKKTKEPKKKATK